MKLNDLFAQLKPLTINKEVVEGAFIKQAPLKELVKLQDIDKAKTIDEKLEKSLELVKICLVDKNGKPLITSKNELSNEYIMEVTTAIIEANSPEGKQI